MANNVVYLNESQSEMVEGVENISQNAMKGNISGMIAVCVRKDGYITFSKFGVIRNAEECCRVIGILSKMHNDTLEILDQFDTSNTGGITDDDGEMA